ncbi:unnamed protein product [Caenorhabditis auriculariae]|uniref:Domain of unknown function DX domain-containing protein n=1 Tax=Caenorhabditis auriculariae TaxID=2777116 RepID=A0A8S1HDP5_9PELO|nr:unnamed protein product [Caenorhabditis auriculariae]
MRFFLFLIGTFLGAYAIKSLSSESCQSIDVNGWLESSDGKFDQDCLSGNPPILCNTEALKCGQEKCCVSESSCGGRLLGESPKLCQSSSDCHLKNGVDVDCVEGVCCPKVIVKREDDDSVCPLSQETVFPCTCDAKTCGCSYSNYICTSYGPKKATRQQRNHCCPIVKCSTGMYAGIVHEKEYLTEFTGNRLNTYAENNLMCNIPLPYLLRRLVFGYKEEIKKKVLKNRNHWAIGFDKTKRGPFKKCATNSDCEEDQYCDHVLTEFFAKDEYYDKTNEMKACFKIPKLYGKVLKDKTYGLQMCNGLTECMAPSHYCFHGFRSFSRVNEDPIEKKGICMEAPIKLCKRGKDCAPDEYCHGILKALTELGHAGESAKKRAKKTDPMFCEKKRHCRSYAKCHPLDHSISPIQPQGVCIHDLHFDGKKYSTPFPIYNGSKQTECQTDRQCRRSSFLTTMMSPEADIYTYKCVPVKNLTLCIHEMLDQSNCTTGEIAVADVDGVTPKCIPGTLRPQDFPYLNPLPGAPGIPLDSGAVSSSEASAAQSKNEHDEGSDEGSTNKIIAIVVGIIFLTILIICGVLGIIIYKKKRRRR